MFGSITTLAPNLSENSTPRAAAEGQTTWLATAALLTRVATVHDEMSEGRWKRLYALLKSALKLDDLTAAQLIDQSAAVHRSAIDLYHAYRPGRNAQQAVVKVEELMFRGHPEVVDADLADYFGSIPHAELLQSVARRIVDRRVLHLIKM
jgi:hypothetical protein